MLSIQKQKDILRKYFVDVSPAEFRERLEKCSPRGGEGNSKARVRRQDFSEVARYCTG